MKQIMIVIPEDLHRLMKSEAGPEGRLDGEAVRHRRDQQQR